MSEILSLFTVFSPHLLATQLRQLCRVVFAVLALTGGVTMRNISRWTPEGGSYRTIQRFYNTLLPWGSLCWVFFRADLFDPDDVYLLAGDETVVRKSGDETHGLSRFFSSTIGKTVPGLAFFALSIISVKKRRSYPLLMEQVLRGEAAPPEEKGADVSKPSQTKGKPGRPKGSQNRNKTQVVLNDTLKQIQSMLKTVLATIDGFIPIQYFLLDGYFGNNNTLQMVRDSGCHLISKLRKDAALYLPPTTPYQGRGRPAIYGEKLNPKEINSKYRVSTQTKGNITTEVYQIEGQHKRFPDPLNVVCLLKTNAKTQEIAHVLLVSSDLQLDAETLIDSYALRFQIEFNFRDAKQFWGLDDFINVNEIPVNNAANLSMFMVNISAKLRERFGAEHPSFGVLDIKARYRAEKYLQETLKILPQKPETIVIDELAEHLGSIGAIHYTSPQSRPG
ncbi:MAG: transposase [Candidatus Poribacteria bacterium]|nr:transposase [Candidatus Poribacteria bacterium]